MIIHPSATVFQVQTSVTSTSISTIFTAPTENAVEITRIFIYQLSGTPTVELFYSDGGGVPTTANGIYKKAIGDSVILGESDSLNLAMTPGATIGANVSASSSVVVTIFGVAKRISALNERVVYGDL